MENLVLKDLILKNKNMIYSLTKYYENYCSKEDLFQAGCIGMITAYNNYDDSMNVKFTTFAYSYILGEMRKLVRENKTLKIPKSTQLLNYKIEKARILLSQKYMREPSATDIANYLQVDLYMVEEAINSTKSVYSLDKPLNEDGYTLSEVVSAKQKDLDSLILLKEELSNLTEFERELIEKRYMNDLTQVETAKYMGMSQVQVSRKEQKVLDKLKSKLVA